MKAQRHRVDMKNIVPLKPATPNRKLAQNLRAKHVKAFPPAKQSASSKEKIVVPDAWFDVFVSQYVSVLMYVFIGAIGSQM